MHLVSYLAFTLVLGAGLFIALDPYKPGLSWQYKVLLTYTDRLLRSPNRETVVAIREAREKVSESAPEFLFGVNITTVVVRDTVIEGVRIRMYEPQNMQSQMDRVVFFHGGGWALGSVNSYDRLCRLLSNDLGRIVISVEYRLAPEYPYPAAVGDCLTVARAVVRQGHRVAVMGDSAGGSLAAVVSHNLALEGIAVIAQVLVYPATDLTRKFPSHQRYAYGYLLTRDDLDAFLDMYIRPEQVKEVNASVLFHPVPTGIAPALVVLAEVDPLFDEGHAYFEHLKKAGVEVEELVAVGAPHGFFSFQGFSDAKDARKVAVAYLVKKFGKK